MLHVLSLLSHHYWALSRLWAVTLALFLSGGVSAYTPPAPALNLVQTDLHRVADHVEDAPPFMDVVPAPQSGTLILVRHADRNRGEAELNALGRARAVALRDALADVPVDAIFMTEFKRNADTARPLARARGLQPQVLPPDENLSTKLVTAAAGGSSVIWIGNVGNLVDLWEALGLGGAAPTTYGQIAVLTAREGAWTVTWRSH
ncbi:MAG: histidine phosphatase family protein [Pseudomonadota bacterium]